MHLCFKEKRQRSEELFTDFKNREKELQKQFGKGSAEAHNQAFIDCKYEERFRQKILNDPAAIEKLKHICERAKDKDLYLICYEGLAKACHRRILLRIAEEMFGTQIKIAGVEPKAP